MKTIKQGKLPEERVYRGTCTNCGTEVECMEKETQVVQDRPSEGRTVDCPLCKSLLWVAPWAKPDVPTLADR